jgi:tRNA threonylcarbamoyladenosine biosynthesis protein TsaE
VTVVEWGGGLVEGLSDERLDIVIRRSVAAEDETRAVTMQGLGPRWSGVDL